MPDRPVPELDALAATIRAVIIDWSRDTRTYPVQVLDAGAALGALVARAEIAEAAVKDEAEQTCIEIGLRKTAEARAEKAERDFYDVEQAYRSAMETMDLAIENYLAARARILRLEEAIQHVIDVSPGTPPSVKGYLRAALAAAREEESE